MSTCCGAVSARSRLTIGRVTCLSTPLPSSRSMLPRRVMGHGRNLDSRVTASPASSPADRSSNGCNKLHDGSGYIRTTQRCRRMAGSASRRVSLRLRARSSACRTGSGRQLSRWPDRPPWRPARRRHASSSPTVRWCPPGCTLRSGRARLSRRVWRWWWLSRPCHSWRVRPGRQAHRGMAGGERGWDACRGDGSPRSCP